MPREAIDMFTRLIHFDPEGVVHDEERTAACAPDSRQLAAFHAETDEDVHADHWEMHPSGEELVGCLSGAMRLYLRPREPDGEEEEIPLTSGNCFIVPRGRWHRIELDEPSDLLSVTPRPGTRLERRAL
jgi:mannose-6-phosphate isomerase-like protein (cupin superfamily)